MKWYEILIIVAAVVVILIPIINTIRKKKNKTFNGCDGCDGNKCSLCKYSKEELMAMYSGNKVYSLLIKSFNKQMCDMIQNYLLHFYPNVTFKFHDDKDSLILMSKTTLDIKRIIKEFKDLGIETREL